MRRRKQAFDDAAVLQVRLDDLVDVLLVDIGVPDGLGFVVAHRATRAAIHAAGLIDANLSGTGQARFLYFLFAVFERLPRTVRTACVFAGLAFIEAEEDVMFVVGRRGGMRAAHGEILFCGSARETRTST